MLGFFAPTEWKDIFLPLSLFPLYFRTTSPSPKFFLELNLRAKWKSRPEQIVLGTGSVKEFDVGLEDYLWKSVMAQVQSLLAGFL